MLQLELKIIYFEPNTPNDAYSIQVFVEVQIGIAPGLTQFLADSTQEKSK